VSPLSRRPFTCYRQVLVNIFISANIVGGISALAALADTAMATHRQRIASFERMLKQEQISDEVAAATRDYLRMRLADSSADLTELPLSVQIRIREQRFSDVIRSSPLLVGLSRRFIGECIARVSEDSFVAGLEICRAGDTTTKLCIVLDGHAALLLSRAGRDESDHGRNEPATVAMLRPGSCFGAEGFVAEAVQPWSIKAITLLRVISLDAQDRRELQRQYPNDWMLLRTNLVTTMSEIGRAARRLATSIAARQEEAANTEVTAAGLNQSAMARVKLQAMNIWLPLSEATSEADQLLFAEEACRAEQELQRANTRASQALATLLCDVAASGDVAELSRMLRMVPIEAIPADYDGRAGLHLASAGGHDETVALLLSNKANVNVIDRFGRTPLAEAVLNGKDSTIKLLVAEGGQLNLGEHEAAGILCEAAHAGDTVLVRRYLAAGINPNAADYDRRTGLMLAAAEGERRICMALLDARADPALADRWGHRALDEAISHGYGGPLVTLLEEAQECAQAGSASPSRTRLQHYVPIEGSMHSAAHS